MINTGAKSKRKAGTIAGFSMTMAPGRLYSLIGPNGSRRTTVIKCLPATIIPDSGTLTLDGRNLLDILRSRIALTCVLFLLVASFGLSHIGGDACLHPSSAFDAARRA